MGCCVGCVGLCMREEDGGGKDDGGYVGRVVGGERLG